MVALPVELARASASMPYPEMFGNGLVAQRALGVVLAVALGLCTCLRMPVRIRSCWTAGGRAEGEWGMAGGGHWAVPAKSWVPDDAVATPSIMPL